MVELFMSVHLDDHDWVLLRQELYLHGPPRFTPAHLALFFFAMDPQTILLMDSVDVILLDLVLSKVDPTREFVINLIVAVEWTLRQGDSNRCLAPNSLAFFTMGSLTTSTMDCVNIILLDLVLFEVDLVGRIVIEWILSQGNSERCQFLVCFTMEFQVVLTMDFLNIILEDLVLVKLDLMRELVTPRILKRWDSSRCLASTDPAFTLFTMGSMDAVLPALLQEVVQDIFNEERVLSQWKGFRASL